MSSPKIDYVQLDSEFGCYGVANDSAIEELRGIYRETFLKETYFKNGLDLPADATVLDVGANVGLFSLSLKHRLPSARVHAFEPAAPNLEALRKNLHLHGADDIVVHPVAIGPRDEASVPFSFFRNMPGNSTRYPEQKAFDKASIVAEWGTELGEHLYDEIPLSVPVERLSTVLRRHSDLENIHLLKIDVEGSELDVLGSLDELDWARVQAVVMEIQDIGEALELALTELARHGFASTVETPNTSYSHLRYRIVYALRSAK